MSITPEITCLIDEIRNNKTDGASQLARQSVSVLKVAAERSRANSTEEFLLEQREIGGRLMSARPAMAPLFNIVSGLLVVIAGETGKMDMASIKSLTISKAEEMIGNSLQAVAEVAERGSELVADGDRVMTHSYSSTVMAALKEAFSEHRSIEVITTKSGQGHTGERIAQELGLYGMPVIFIDDVAMGLYLATVSKVVVGADRICADGGVVNGIGTYLLALAARGVGVPFYVLCEALKFDPRLRSDEVDLEEEEPGEVDEPGSLPSTVRVKNPHFDVTPLELVTGIVTEDGLLTPAEVLNYIKKQSGYE